MIDMDVKLRGGLFKGDIPRVVQKQIVHEILNKVEERTKRQGRGQTAKYNTISHQHQGLELQIRSTLFNRRVTGRSWQRKNIGIIKSMSGRVGRKAAERIAAEMS